MMLRVLLLVLWSVQGVKIESDTQAVLALLKGTNSSGSQLLQSFRSSLTKINTTKHLLQQ